MSHPRRFRSPRFAPLALGVALALGLAACDGSGTEGENDSDAAYDSYARAVCLATSRVVATLEPKLQPGASPPLDAIAEAWKAFITDLERAKPPSGLASWHRDWLKMEREDLAKLQSGDPEYYDPFDHAPEMSKELGERFSRAYARVPECELERSTPVAGTPSPSAPSATGPIDYGSPDKYLRPGSQSTLNDESMRVIKAQVSAQGKGIETAGAVAAWLRTSFRTVQAGGATIGKTDVNALVTSRSLTGCHDSALVMVAVLRSFGIPALMADTAAIQWAEDYRGGKTRSFVGHVFVEAYVDNHWILVECGSATYASDYNPGNTVITCPTMPDPKGYFVIARGLDPADYGVTSVDVLNQRMTEAANRLPGMVLEFPAYRWAPLPLP